MLYKVKQLITVLDMVVRGVSRDAEPYQVYIGKDILVLNNDVIKTVPIQVHRDLHSGEFMIDLPLNPEAMLVLWQENAALKEELAKVRRAISSIVSDVTISEV